MGDSRTPSIWPAPDSRTLRRASPAQTNFHELHFSKRGEIDAFRISRGFAGQTAPSNEDAATGGLKLGDQVAGEVTGEIASQLESSDNRPILSANRPIHDFLPIHSPRSEAKVRHSAKGDGGTGLMS